MSRAGCGLDGGELAARILGVLGPAEAAAVDAHLERCARCRAEAEDLVEMIETLDDLPAEAVLDGPPDSDLLLHRTLRRVRAERAAGRRRRRLVTAAAAVLVAAVLFGGGLAAGGLAGGGVLAAGLPGSDAGPESGTTAQPIAGTRTVRTTQGAVSASVTLVPAEGWVRLAADVRGVPAGERCRLIVVAADGSREVAGSWVVPAGGESREVNGSAAVPPEAVQEVLVQDDEGTTYARLAI